MNNKELLQNILGSLEKEGLLPLNMDLSSVGNRFWAVVYDNKRCLDSNLNLMTEEVYTGLADSQEEALLKALSERVERLSFIQGHRSGLASCMTDRSDGFAAMPKFFDQSKVKENSLNEAIERYVWASWWDNDDIKFNIMDILETNQKVQESSYLKWIFSEFNLEKLIVIKPSHNRLKKEVQIVFGKIKNAGYISGGACGNDTDSEKVFLRGIDELLRHGLAYVTMSSHKIEPKSFYEKRVHFFASGKGNIIVQNKLSSDGSQIVELTDLIIDESIPSVSEHYHVYRVLFKDQPAFVGGKLERLCL